MKNILKICLAVGLLVSSLAASNESKPIGSIKSMKGIVVVLRAGERLQASKGFKLYKDDDVRTVKFSKATIEFEDETIVHLGKASELKVNDYVYDGEHSKVALNAKEGLFQVITGKIGKINPHRFNVKTSSVTIGIRGTSFDIRNENGKTDIGCFSGKIVLVSKDGSSAVVNKGEMISVKHVGISQYEVKKAPNSFFTLEDLGSGYYLMRDINKQSAVYGYEKKGGKVVASFSIDELTGVDFRGADYLKIDQDRFEKLKFLAK